jgi:hypothetical protein
VLPLLVNCGHCELATGHCDADVQGVHVEVVSVCEGDAAYSK